MNVPRNANQGFTLIEMLAAISLFVTVGAMVVAVAFISLRGSKKTDMQAILRENGDFALSQMVRNIRYAKSLSDPPSCVGGVTQSSISITSILDNGQTTYSCPNTPPYNSGTGITSNSASLVNTNAVNITACSFTCMQQSASEPPTITVQFTVQSVLPNNFIENNGSIHFQSSVSMRNFSTFNY